MILLVVWTFPGASAQNGPPPAWSPAKSLGMFAYPKNNQNPDQQLKEESDCCGSARQNTGIDPQAPSPQAPSAQQQQAAQQQAAQQAGRSVSKGGTVMGAAGGAAIGAIAGDAGTRAVLAPPWVRSQDAVSRERKKSRPGQLNRQHRVNNKLNPRLRSI